MSTATSSSPTPGQSHSGAPTAFRASSSASNPKRRESDHSFTSRGPVVEIDDDSDGKEPAGGAHDRGSDVPPQDEDPRVPSSAFMPGLHDKYDTLRPSRGDQREGSIPAPSPGALNRADPRGPLPAFRILGHPEFDDSVPMPEPSHLRPPDFLRAGSESSRSSRGTELTDDDEKLWEENQALYRAIQSRLGIEDDTPSEQSSSAPTPVLPIPGSFPSALGLGGDAEGRENESEGEGPPAFHVRPLRPFPEPAHTPSTTSGASPSPSMPHPAPARVPFVERPSTDSFFTTNSDSVYLTPHPQESVESHGAGDGQEAEGSDPGDDEEEDYTQRFPRPPLPEQPSTPPPLPAASLPEPTTPKASALAADASPPPHFESRAHPCLNPSILPIARRHYSQPRVSAPSDSARRRREHECPGAYRITPLLHEWLSVALCHDRPRPLIIAKPQLAEETHLPATGILSFPFSQCLSPLPIDSLFHSTRTNTSAFRHWPSGVVLWALITWHAVLAGVVNFSNPKASLPRAGEPQPVVVVAVPYWPSHSLGEGVRR
ncbi:hypothetical protein NMY22_g12244 [Coprinellus aureogranulatus]|nr:hypothetical protein NMY22_g12244 [Coprinellus aureogranulatus]